MTVGQFFSQPNRTERLEARLLPEQKRRIERAAGYKGLSVSDFAVQAADEAAARTIREQEVWALSDTDRDAFMEGLLHPPEPNEPLLKAIKRYRKFSAGNG